jgi:hypothetical protein
MPEQTTTLPSGTQITERKQPVKPNLQEACQAMVTTQVVICEPMTDGTWRLVTSFQDNYNIVLDQRDPTLARREVTGRIGEVKQTWRDKGRIISLENLLTTEPLNLSKMEKNLPSSAHSAEQTS